MDEITSTVVPRLCEKRKERGTSFFVEAEGESFALGSQAHCCFAYRTATLTRQNGVSFSLSNMRGNKKGVPRRGTPLLLPEKLALTDLEFVT